MYIKLLSRNQTNEEMTKFEKYAALQADFYQYMCIEGGISSKTASDYVTRLKFLSYDYILWTKT